MNTLMDSLPKRHRITVDEYHRMGEAGVFAPEARVELIEGEIIDMAPIGIDHSYVVDRLAHLFGQAAGDKGWLRIQGTIRLDGDSEPQPDVALLAPRGERYRRTQPGPADVLLLIEVGDTSLRYDLDEKVPLYARHGIPELWVVDLPNRQLHRFAKPVAGKYLDQSATGTPALTSIAALPGVSVDLRFLFAEATNQQPSA